MPHAHSFANAAKSTSVMDVIRIVIINANPRDSHERFVVTGYHRRGYLLGQLDDLHGSTFATRITFKHFKFADISTR